MRERLRVAAASALALMLLAGGAARAAAEPAGEYPEFPYPQTTYDEPQRGQFHFSPRAGWKNDINAPLYYRGQYHVFFQHNPHGLNWDTMHWGHATSPDLVHWTQRSIALEPDVHPGDLWSGGGVVDVANTSGLKSGDDDPIVVFSGRNGVQVFYSTDGARTFAAYDHGRAVADPGRENRDPMVFWHSPSARWVMVLWSEDSWEVGRGVEIYTSPNLLDWTWASRFTADWLMECPALVELATPDGTRRWVLMDGAGEYVLGDFDGHTFTADASAPAFMDQGDATFEGTFYGPLIFSGDPRGRTVQMAWQPSSAGTTWTGGATFPAELGLAERSGRLVVTRRPIAELGAVEVPVLERHEVTLGGGTPDPLAGLRLDAATLRFRVDRAASAGTLTLTVRRGGQPGRAITIDLAGTIDGAAWPLTEPILDVTVLLDRSQLAVFADGGRFSRSDSLALPPGDQAMSLTASDGVRITDLKVSAVASTWGTDEATLATNLATPLAADGGAWTDVATGKRGRSVGADAFYRSTTEVGDGVVDADVTLESGDAAGITVRADAATGQHYTVSLTSVGTVKLWRPGRDLAETPYEVVPGRPHHVRIRLAGDRIQAYLDHGGQPLIDVRDATTARGRVGLAVYDAVATFDNLTLDGPALRSRLQGPWLTASGAWTTRAGGLVGRAAGDGLALSATRAGDLDYRARVRLVSGDAAALVFRATRDGSDFYAANLTAAGTARLWRPGVVLASVPARVQPGRWHDVRVLAVADRIRVFIDGDQVIDVRDAHRAEGLLGLNAFSGNSEFTEMALSVTAGVMSQPRVDLAGCQKKFVR